MSFVETNRAKMANIHCGGSQTIIHVDNSLHFVSGIIVNITTANDDGTVTYQALTLNEKTLKAVRTSMQTLYVQPVCNIYI